MFLSQPILPPRGPVNLCRVANSDWLEMYLYCCQPPGQEAARLYATVFASSDVVTIVIGKNILWSDPGIRLELGKMDVRDFKAGISQLSGYLARPLYRSQ